MDIQLTFPPQPDEQSPPQCSTVTIVNDNILEAEEMFLIEVLGVSPEVSPDPSASRATVEIIDDDRMSLLSM